MDNVKLSATPMIPNMDLSINSELIKEPKEYKRIIGSLQYLTLTHPDIQLEVNRLSQFIGKPSVLHWVVMKRVLRFLAGTMTHGILLRLMIGIDITAYCDVDWGGDTVDRQSRTWFLVYVGGSLVRWSSKKKGIVASRVSRHSYDNTRD